MDKFIKKFGKLCVQDGFIQGLESLSEQIKKVGGQVPLEKVNAGIVLSALQAVVEKTVSDLKQEQEKQWNEFEAEYSKEKEK